MFNIDLLKKKRKEKKEILNIQQLTVLGATSWLQPITAVAFTWKSDAKEQHFFQDSKKYPQIFLLPVTQLSTKAQPG